MRFVICCSLKQSWFVKKSSKIVEKYLVQQTEKVAFMSWLEKDVSNAKLVEEKFDLISSIGQIFDLSKALRVQFAEPLSSNET